MKHIALLRGINVGGKGIIKMTDLKQAVEKGGFKNVRTYIQSGNVIFDSDGPNIKQITTRLEEILLISFQFNSGIIIKNHEQFKKVLLEVPSDWKTRHDLRCYIAFIREPTTAQDVICEIELNDGVDSIKAGDQVLYMSTLLSGLTRSRFTRLITKKVYKDITIRNFNTAQKLLALMEYDI
jgi:uncharacterized protein (DUF1697 family)